MVLSCADGAPIELVNIRVIPRIANHTNNHLSLVMRMPFFRHLESRFSNMFSCSCRGLYTH